MLGQDGTVYVSADVAAELLGVGKRWVLRLCVRGSIRGAMLVGSKLWIIPLDKGGSPVIAREHGVGRPLGSRDSQPRRPRTHV